MQHAMNPTTPATDTEGARLALAERLAGAEQEHMKARAKLVKATDRTAAALEQARAALEDAQRAHRTAAEELARADGAHRHTCTRLQKQLRELTPLQIKDFVRRCHGEAERLREGGPKTRRQETGRRWAGGPPETVSYSEGASLDRRLVGLRDAWLAAERMIFEPLTEAELEAKLVKLWDALPALELRRVS